MKKQLLRSLIILGTALPMLHVTNVTAAKPSINDMQTCQGLIGFLEFKLEQTSAQHDATDKRIVLDGLTAYDRYIQKQIVTPGLLSFNKGDKAKADAMQTQVTAYKQTIIQRYNKRFPAPKLYMDYAVSLNECAKKAVPQGEDLNKLKQAMNTLIKLTQAK